MKMDEKVRLGWVTWSYSYYILGSELNWARGVYLDNFD